MLDMIFDVHNGIWLNDVFLKFETNINEVDLNVNMEQYEDKFYLYEGNLSIEIKDNLIVSFTVCLDQHSPFNLLYRNINIKALNADRIISFFDDEFGEKVKYLENGHLLLWPTSDICCWREVTTDDVQELIEESKRENVYEQMKDELREAKVRSECFETITIASKGYYNTLIQ